MYFNLLLSQCGCFVVVFDFYLFMREIESFHLLVYSPNRHNGQESRTQFRPPHAGDRNKITCAVTTVSRDLYPQEAGIEGRDGC